MSVEEATRFFRENCYYEEKPARAEAMRGTFDPGYLNYTLGKLEILKLRDDYKAQERANFSAQKFHNELLNHGMPPIRLLRELMLKDKSKWDEVLSSSSESPNKSFNSGCGLLGSSSTSRNFLVIARDRTATVST